MRNSSKCYTRNSLEWVTRNSSELVTRNSSGYDMRNSSELVLIYSREIVTRKSPAPAKPLPLYRVACSSQKFLNWKPFPGNSRENLPFLLTFDHRIFPRLIPGNFRGFLGISTDFPQIFFLCNIEKFIIDVRKFIESNKKQICVFLE